jgi:hypothetical protein
MKKLLVILCVLVLLALVVVPVLAEALSAVDGPNHQMAPHLPGTTRRAEVPSPEDLSRAEKDLDHQMAPCATKPGTYRGAKAPIWVQMARGTWRSPSA